MCAMWTSVTTIEIAKDNLKWRRRCRESKLTLSVWSASGGQSSPFGMRGQPMIQYVLYCIVLCTIQCEANQRAPTRHYDPSGRPLHCPCTTMMACSATFLSCHLNTEQNRLFNNEHESFVWSGHSLQWCNMLKAPILRVLPGGGLSH